MYGKRLRAPMARAAWGVWGHAPQKIFKSESLKTPFPALSGCVKIDPKIHCYSLLNFDKKSVVIN